VVSCTKNRVEKTENSNEINQLFLEQIKTEKALSNRMNTELSLTGKVEYDPDRIIHYAPLVSGVVERTYFSLGDKVVKGQPLVDIRSSELSALQSEYIAAESEMGVAGRDLQSAQAMYDDKLLSEKELLEAKSKYKQTQASFEKVKSDRSLYVRQATGAFSILSPMSGYIVTKSALSSSPVSTDGTPLFSVADLSQVWIMANVYAGDLQSVKEGMPVEITTLSYPGEVFTGKIDALSQVFDPEEKVLKARIVMPNKELKFKPEMSVMVKLKNETSRNRVSVPTGSLIFDDNQYFVVVETAPSHFEIRQVELEGHHQETSYLRAGLEENEKVVVENQLLIYSGLKGE
jgi:cobalt-zinc-cadmium efflux system membrane fusion protein